MTDDERYLVLFDGVCVFCMASVKAALKNASPDIVRILPLQSPIGKRFADRLGLGEDLETMIVLSSDHAAATKSAAALKMFRLNPTYRPIAKLLLWVPAPIRDLVYDAIGRVRYRVFGQVDTCVLPDDILPGVWADEPYCAEFLTAIFPGQKPEASR